MDNKNLTNRFKQKPVNLSLMTIRFPLPAIVSILHRISGFLLFLSIPLFIIMLQASLASEQKFANLRLCMTHPFMKFFWWVIISFLIYHLIAGIRHLLMDAGVGESKEGGKQGALIVMILSVIFILLAGFWIW